CSGWLFQLSLEVPPPLMFPMTVTPLGRTRTAALRSESRMCRPLGSWILEVGARPPAVSLYFIFPGICTLSLVKFGIPEADLELTMSGKRTSNS
ncbi:hypothetical protein STEG23_026030, partial [Scotinomys teguina]